MNNRRFGVALMLLGLLLIIAALLLYGFNIRQEKLAGEASASVLSEVTEILKSSDSLTRTVVELESQEPSPEYIPAVPGSMPSYVSERGVQEVPQTISEDGQAAAEPSEEPSVPEKDDNVGTETTFEEENLVHNPTLEEENSTEESTLEQANPTAEPTPNKTGSVTRPLFPPKNSGRYPVYAYEETEAEPGELPSFLPDYLAHPEVEMPEKVVNGYAYIGTLDIPELSLSLPIMSSWTYAQLNNAPCRYCGSAYMDNFVIIAHNYSTHFGRINELRPGDEVIFTDMNGNVLRYEVVETEILERGQVLELTESGYALTLLTCTIGGRSRVTVRCDRVLDFEN